jgi:hypothetical protein
MSNESAKSQASFYGRLTFIASVVMNAISLINVGRDLKITIVRWNEFFVSLLDFGEKIINFLFLPFSAFFNIFSINVPSEVKQTYTVFLLFIIGLARKELDRSSAGLRVLLQVVFAALAISAVVWFLGFGISALVIEEGYKVAFLMVLVVGLLIMMILIGNEYTKSRKDGKPSETLRFFKNIVLLIFALALLNYFILTLDGDIATTGG